MSPLVRPLLALAAAALLASAHAEDEGQLLGRQGLEKTPDKCGELVMGATPDKDEYIGKRELDPFNVNPTNKFKFDIKVLNSAKLREALVGQRVWVCDFLNPDKNNKIVVKAHKPDLHSPLRVTCSKGCTKNVEVIPDQFLINKLS